MSPRRPHPLFAITLLGLALCAPGVGFSQPDEPPNPASFTIDANLGRGADQSVAVVLRCIGEQGREVFSDAATLSNGGTVEFQLAGPAQGDVVCVVSAEHATGLGIRYRGDGGSEVDIGAGGCRFGGVSAGHANFCQVQLEVQTTSVTVFKKWIGARAEEADVEARLICEDRDVEEPRRVNAGRPGAWTLDVTEPEGLPCAVVEAVREDFVPDMSDCENLLVLPGAQEECTLVNTKVVKMIDMLNRYGLGIMIVAFAVVGMLAARKFVP